tara:strand:- start:6842 stop:8374 length:1533 start_codon:yes stop_codon:yes gene_type:complete
MAIEKRTKSTTEKGITGMLWNLSGSVVQIIIKLFVIGVLARLLTPEEFGIVAIMMLLVTFSELFSQMGIGSALIQLPKITSSHIAQGYSLSVLIGLLIGILFFFLAPIVGTFFDLTNADNAIRFFAIFFPLRSFNSITSAMLTRHLRFQLIVKTNVVSYVFGMGLTSIILAYLGLGYWALIWGQFAALMISLLSLMYYERPSFALRFEKPILRDLMFFGSGHTLGSIFNYFAENADNIIVGKLLGTSILGVYSKAFQLLAIPAQFFGNLFDKVLFPILSLKQDQKKKLAEFYLFSSSICFGMLIPLSVIVFINAKFIVDTLLGNQWQEVIVPFQILILGLAHRFGTKINKSYLKSIGLIYRGAYYQLIFAILMFVCCSVGAYLYGIIGVAFGVLLATILNYLQVSYRLYVELKFSMRLYFTMHLKTILVHLPFLTVTLVLFYYFEITSHITHLVLSICIYIPLMTLIFINKNNIIFNKQNFQLLSQILKSFPNSMQKKFMKIRFLNQYYA